MTHGKKVITDTNKKNFSWIKWFKGPKIRVFRQKKHFFWQKLSLIEYHSAQKRLAEFGGTAPFNVKKFAK